MMLWENFVALASFMFFENWTFVFCLLKLRILYELVKENVGMMAVCGILESRGRVLLCRRLSCSCYPGRWELPTFEYEGEGSVEETLEQGLFERLTLRAKSTALLSTQNLRSFRDCRLWVYRVDRWDGAPFITGYGAYRFVSSRDLGRFALLPDHVTFIKKFFSFRNRSYSCALF